MCSVKVEDLDAKNIDDVFRICSHARLQDPIQKRGIELKRRWLLKMLDKRGPLTKIAYLEGRPVAQMLFYPEELMPHITSPRKDVIVIRCAYNPFPEARGKGAGTLLVKSLLEECRSGMKILGGSRCSFIVARPFQTGEGVSLGDFYSSIGFEKAGTEMFLEISEKYVPRKTVEYKPLSEDEGRAIVFYNPLCEYSYPFALRIKDQLREIEPSLRVELIDEWMRPWESVKRGNHWLIVNAKPIRSFVTQREEFRREMEKALKG